MGFETPEEGYLAKILLHGGSKDVPIGKLLCIIVSNLEDVAKFKNFKADDVEPAAESSMQQVFFFFWYQKLNFHIRSGCKRVNLSSNPKIKISIETMGSNWEYVALKIGL